MNPGRDETRLKRLHGTNFNQVAHCFEYHFLSIYFDKWQTDDEMLFTNFDQSITSCNETFPI